MPWNKATYGAVSAWVPHGMVVWSNQERGGKEEYAAWYPRYAEHTSVPPRPWDKGSGSCPTPIHLCLGSRIQGYLFYFHSPCGNYFASSKGEQTLALSCWPFWGHYCGRVRHDLPETPYFCILYPGIRFPEFLHSKPAWFRLLYWVQYKPIKVLAKLQG